MEGYFIKQNTGRIAEKGEFIICIKESVFHGDAVVGNKYRVINVETFAGTFYYLIDKSYQYSSTKEVLVSSENFIRLADIREDKINRILNE